MDETLPPQRRSITPLFQHFGLFAAFSPPSFGARSNFFFVVVVWQIQTAPTGAQLQLPGYTGVTKTV